MDYKIQSVQDQDKAALPLNAVTETLFYNHRLIVDSPLYNDDSEARAWLISKVNRVSPNGISIITMAQDIYDPHNDYIEKDSSGKIIGMWADYWKDNKVIAPTTPANPMTTDPPEVTAKITCTGKPLFKIGGSAKTFTISYYRQNGEEYINYVPGKWELYVDGLPAPDGLLTTTLVEDGKKIKVKFLGDDSYIGKIVTLVNTARDITAAIEVEIAAL